MNVISKDPRIIDLDGHVHLLTDKLICFEPGLFDLSHPNDVALLLKYIDTLYGSDDELLRFGNDSVCVLTLHPEGGHLMDQIHAIALPESSRRAIEYARYRFNL